LGHIGFLITCDGAEMMKEEALIKAMVDAILAPSDAESEEATQLGLEIARNMKLSEVVEAQKKALDIVNMANELRKQKEVLH
jgi:hypothetical protein